MRPTFLFRLPATTALHTLSLHDALPISWPARQRPASQMLDLDDFVLHDTTGGTDHHDLTLFLADHRPGNGRGDRDLAFLDLGLVLADDPIGHFLIGFDIGDGDRGAEDDLAGIGN